MIQSNQYHLRIADFLIGVFVSDDNIILNIPDYISSFVSYDTGVADIIIKIHKCIPERYGNFEVLFNSNMETMQAPENIQSNNWCVCRSGHNNYVRIYSNSNIDKPELIAVFNNNASNWDIFLKSSAGPEATINIDPFVYPLGPLILYYVNILNDGFMIHSAGIDDNGKGYIFCGHSGAGKTTISKIWHQEKAIVINDDRLIIRKIKDDFFMYNSPMNYKDSPKKALLEKIFILKQSDYNYAAEIVGSESIGRVASYCIQHNYNARLIDFLMNICIELTKKIAVYELGFVPDKSIAHFVRSYKFKNSTNV